MQLLTNEIRRQLPPLYSTEKISDPTVWVKFFTPYSSWTWYVTEFDGQDTFFGLVQGFDEELGYFSLTELQNARGPYGLSIERDLHFQPTPLSKLRRGRVGRPRPRLQSLRTALMRGSVLLPPHFSWHLLSTYILLNRLLDCFVMTLSCPQEQPSLVRRITRSAFRYFGGKWLLGGWIRSHFSQHDCYVEPFGGAFSVGLQKQPVETEIYSDLNVDTVNFFQVLQQQSDELIDAISNSPRTKSEFQRCQEPCDHPGESQTLLSLLPVGLYWRGWPLESWSQLFQAFGHATSWKVDHSEVRSPIESNQCNSSTQMRSIVSRDFMIPPEHCSIAIRPILIVSRGSKDKRHQHPVTPRRQYRHEMTDENHRQLAEVLHRIQGRAIVSSYACPLYEELYPNWVTGLSRRL